MRAPFLPGAPDPGSYAASGSPDEGALLVRSRVRPARRTWTPVAVLAAVACLGWVPFAGRTLSPDEGGFLVVAAQWGPGSSLYGDYWVDRPPGLIALFAAADRLGGPWALRALGVVAVALAVVLAGVIGRLVAPHSAKAVVLPAVTASVFLATPLLGGSVVNGEVLGLPFVLAGIAAALASLNAPAARPAIAWAVAAGASGAAAFMVKQSLADVFVIVLAVMVVHRRPAAARLASGAFGGAVLLVTLVLWAAAELRGTGAGELWNAVVTFRGEATATIAESATASTAGRLGGLLLALVASGAPVVAIYLAWVARRRLPTRAPGDVESVDLRWPAYALLGWEGLAVLAGGSYWLHYLMGLVPGLVVLTAAAAQRRPRLRTFTVAYAGAAISTVAAIGWVAVHPIERPEAPVISYLDDHSRPGDTGVVAFGGANILQAAGLESPYPYLWSLPVRVRDPQLDALADVLSGADAPTWLVVSGGSLGSWGIDDRAVEGLVESRYELATHAGRFTVYRRTDLP